MNAIEVNGTTVNITWVLLPNTRDVLYYRVYYNSTNPNGKIFICILKK